MAAFKPGMVLETLVCILSSPFTSNVHRGRVNPSPRIADQMRYPGATIPPASGNRHGELEELPDGVTATHWFVEASGVTWHLVSAGDPTGDTVLMLHGLPESWYAFHHQIADLAADHYVIAVDLKGYGQSDRRRGLDYSNPTMARELVALLDKLGIEQFNVVAHDRGSILGDHLTAVPGMAERMRRYVRMQQSGSEPHSEPKPPHWLFANRLGVLLFRSSNFVRSVYNSFYVAIALPARDIDRLDHEFKYAGVAEAVSDNYKTTNFDIELKERHDFLFSYMTMPVLFLQGSLDPGQHPHEYEQVTDYVREGYLQFIEAGHFLHLEKPEAVNAAIRDFLQRPLAADEAEALQARKVD